MNFRVFGLALLVLFLPSTLSAADGRTVRVGAFNFYPGIFMDTDGEVKGFYVDTLAEIGKEQNITFQYVWGTWSEGLERIKSGELDLLTSVAYTAERAAYMDYGTIPLLTVWSELYVDTESDIDSIAAFEGKKVALMQGDFNARNFRTLIENFHISTEFIEVPSFDEVFEAVAKKKADGGVVNCTFGVAKQKEYNIRSTGVVFNPFDIFFTVAAGKNSDLLRMLDGYLGNWKHQQSSVYTESRQKWSYGDIGSIQIIPQWITYAVAVLVLLLAIFLVFSLMLRIRVRSATKEILAREALLKESESKLRSYIQNAPDGVFVVDAEGHYLDANPAAQKITGYSIPEIISMSIQDIQPPESVEKDLQYFQNLKNKGRSSDEFRFRRKDGEIRWWSVEGVKVSDDRYLGFAKDTTDRIISEEKIRNLLHEKEILLKEVHHRIKNNMSTIRGLLQLQKDSLQDSPAISAIQDAESRVQSMIVLYDKLYCSDNYRELPIRVYLEPLLSDIFSTFPNSGKVALKTDLGDFILNVQFLAPLGIMVNELITNCMKHAFKNRDSGIITVSASTNGGLVTILIQDNGTGFPESPSKDSQVGFGLNLVQMLMQQIRGTFRRQNENGTSIILQFSADQE